VISTENNTKIADIKVGASPTYMERIYGKGLLYVANGGSDTVSVISTENNTKIADIKVGENPDYIKYDDNRDNLYVSHPDSDTVSVISTENNTKIADIKVGENPRFINIDIILDKNVLYVANGGSDTVSVISRKNNTKIADIKVGENPDYMYKAIVDGKGLLYVANGGSDTVSVISTENNTKIADIKVGENPRYIISRSGTLYVNNWGSKGISVIDMVTNKVVAGITFSVNPFNSGIIICNDNMQPPISRLFYVYSNTQCTAIPNTGFEFSSWIKNLDNNSSRFIKMSHTNTSIFGLFLNIFGINSNTDAELNITEFGSFTAHFREIPPPIPSEYLIGLYTIVATTIVGWSIPSIIRWLKSRADIRKLNQYHRRINLLYHNGKLDDEDIEPLDKLKDIISDDYAKGNLNELHYNNLKDEISVLYHKIYNNKLTKLNQLSITSEKMNYMQKIKDEIIDEYAKGNLNELHYKLLEKKLPNHRNNDSY
jgi:YVTN family beta-propeller protein